MEPAVRPALQDVQEPRPSSGRVAGWLRKMTWSSEAPSLTPPPVVSTHWLQRPTLAAGGWVDVVGESHRQDTLESLAGGRTPEGLVNRRFMAQLVRDAHNAQDPNAVRVEIGGRLVGFIAHEEAPWCHRVVAELARYGKPATCRASLTGGWDRGPDDRGHIGVVLDVCVPLRMAPTDVPLLPGGRKVTVTNETNYQDALGLLLEGSDRAVPAVATLTTADWSKIDVYIGGRLVGDLTPMMSARYLPSVMDVWAAQDVPTCRAVIRPGAASIEVELDLWSPDD